MVVQELQSSEVIKQKNPNFRFFFTITFIVLFVGKLLINSTLRNAFGSTTCRMLKI